MNSLNDDIKLFGIDLLRSLCRILEVGDLANGDFWDWTGAGLT